MWICRYIGNCPCSTIKVGLLLLSAMNTRQIILVSIAILLVGALAVWWYFGFSLDFMRFFAAEPGTTDRPTDNRTCNAPVGCTCQVVQCIQPPCDPIIVCPSLAPTGQQVVCLPPTQEVKVGAAANLTATGGDGTYQWFAPDGVVSYFGTSGGTATSNNASVVYATAGTKKVTVQSPRGDGTRSVDSVACTVVVQ